MPQFNEVVAVYGTLRDGFSNNKRTGLDTQESLGLDTTLPEYELWCNSCFPKMFKGGNLPVVMEVFNVTSKDVFKELDALEGHRDGVKSGYHREKIVLTSGRTAWTYIYYSDNKFGTQLFQGDWKKHIL